MFELKFDFTGDEKKLKHEGQSVTDEKNPDGTDAVLPFPPVPAGKKRIIARHPTENFQLWFNADEEKIGSKLSGKGPGAVLSEEAPAAKSHTYRSSQNTDRINKRRKVSL